MKTNQTIEDKSALRAKVIDAICYKPSIMGHKQQFENVEALIAEAEKKAEIKCLQNVMGQWKWPALAPDWVHERLATLTKDNS